MNVHERILDAAVQLFAELGSRGATTRRIAAAAQVNEVTLFRHFASKEALLREALNRAAERVLVERLPEEPRDPGRELTEWCRRHLEGMHAARALLRTSMGEFEENPEVGLAAGEVPTRVAAELEAYLLRLREQGIVPDEADLQAAGAMLLGALLADAISRDIIPDRYPYPPEEAAARYVRLFLRAIDARPGTPS